MKILLGISEIVTKGLGEMASFCSSFNLPLLGLLLSEEPVFSRLMSQALNYAAFLYTLGTEDVETLKE